MQCKGIPEVCRRSAVQSSKTDRKRKDSTCGEGKDIEIVASERDTRVSHRELVDR